MRTRRSLGCPVSANRKGNSLAIAPAAKVEPYPEEWGLTVPERSGAERVAALEHPC
jgi:hypothetical protein